MLPALHSQSAAAASGAIATGQRCRRDHRRSDCRAGLTPIGGEGMA